MKTIPFNWKKLAYGYVQTDYRYCAEWNAGSWHKGQLIMDPMVTVPESSSALQYAQECFEGIKAFSAVDGKIHLFRIDLNAERFQESCRRVLIPELSKEQFMKSVLQVVKANQKWVPPYDPERNTALYVRPYAFGCSAMQGAKPADQYMYRCYCLPVAPHYGDLETVKLMVTDYDRAAPRGTGGYKVSANYAEGLLPSFLARQKGYADCLYLDPETHTKIEETSGANFAVVTKDKKIISPKSLTILNSVTRRSLLQIARDYLKIEAYEDILYLDDLDSVAEAFMCGTGAAITPVGGIMTSGGYKQFGDGKIGPVTKELFTAYKNIQRGVIEAPAGWIYTV